MLKEKADSTRKFQFRKTSMQLRLMQNFAMAGSTIAMPKKLPISEDQKTPEFRLRTFGKVVVTLAALAALIAFVVYMYRSMVPEIV